MKKIGIITIHKIYNYGSVLQAYALQKFCENNGNIVEIIDYNFPNVFQKNASNLDNSFEKNESIQNLNYLTLIKDFIIKLLYSIQLFKQHRSIDNFVKQYLKLSFKTYNSPQDLLNNPPIYDIYITGSDQIWNPRYTYGDPSFFLNFAPEDKLIMSYSSSFGTSILKNNYLEAYKNYLKRYKRISIREKSGANIIKGLVDKEAQVVLDPTLLLNAAEWNYVTKAPKVKNEKYILCYYLNYSFNAFPYVDELVEHLHQLTGYKIIKLARPPKSLINKSSEYKVAASPEEFLGWIQNASLVLTTSFHGTAFAVNFKIPFFSIVHHKKTKDSRVLNFLESVGLDSRILSLDDPFPTKEQLFCDYTVAKKKLEILTYQSKKYLLDSIRNDKSL